MAFFRSRWNLAATAALAAVLAAPAAAQQSNAAAEPGKYTPPVTMTSEQMHAHMMQQLGIEAMQPGPSGDPTAPMPPVNHGLLDGKLAWRQDDGGHTDAPNMIFFIHWANPWMKYTKQSQ